MFFLGVCESERECVCVLFAVCEDVVSGLCPKSGLLLFGGGLFYYGC